MQLKMDAYYPGFASSLCFLAHDSVGSYYVERVRSRHPEAARLPLLQNSVSSTASDNTSLKKKKKKKERGKFAYLRIKMNSEN